VKFLVDARLPARLAGLLGAAGHDAVPMSQLPEANRRQTRRSLPSRMLKTGWSSRKLLVVATGNISNGDLLAMFTDDLETVVVYGDGQRRRPHPGRNASWDEGPSQVFDKYVASQRVDVIRAQTSVADRCGVSLSTSSLTPAFSVLVVGVSR
jgi:hypothetical protein